MASKLPKPRGLRLPQIRPKIGTITENLVDKTSESHVHPKKRAHEAPVTSTFRFEQTLKLKRKSKSVTDLCNLLDKPITTFDSLKLPLCESKQTSQNKPAANVKRPIVKPLPVKPVGVSTGAKRPLTNKVDDGASKPKITKKIPDWDYKGRFYQLNEKYQAVQEAFKDTKAKVIRFDELATEHESILEENRVLKRIKETLETRCKDYDDLSIKYTELKNRYSTLQKEHEAVLKKNNELEKERVHYLEKNNALQSTNQEIHIANEKLLEENTDIKAKISVVTNENNFFKEQNNGLLEAFENGQKEIQRLTQSVSTLQAELQTFDEERRALHNIIQDLKGNIRVFCRIRPSLSSEFNKLQCCINLLDENGLEIRKSRESVNQITGKSQDFKSEFIFDKVFSHDSTQEEIFEDLAQLVQSALDGYDVCVFAYGQTGSGKTYTMQGGDGCEQGMIPRTINLIFENIWKLNQRNMEYQVHASFLEIYNENIHDLLNLNTSQKLEIYFNEGRGTTVTNLTKQPISSAAELEMYMRRAHSNRATATTDFNEHSSRSHAVTKIYLQGTGKGRNVVYNGSLNLVDLAGSENAKQSVAGDRLTETKNINKSLATLGDVICALHNKTKHVPYRNSKLTYLLQSCLGGNSKTLMIVNIAPFEDCFGESISSLRFASKVKEVKTASKRNKQAIPQISLR